MEPETFWNKLDKRGQCWLWTGRTNGFDGYGKFGRRYAHRMAWEYSHGDIPDGLLVLHRCDVKACCNPGHLFLGTQLDNVRDRISKGRPGNTKGNRRRQTQSRIRIDGARETRRVARIVSIVEEACDLEVL